MQRVIHQEVGNVHDDVEALCPRMVIIDHGRKLYDGGIASIRERFGGERTLIATLEDLPHGVRLVRVDGPRLLLGFGRDSLPAHELVAWLGARHRLHDVTFQEPETEDVIRRIYEEGLLTREPLSMSIEPRS